MPISSGTIGVLMDPPLAAAALVICGQSHKYRSKETIYDGRLGT